jgi:glycosyltransferase involved in cell wall biosynthesis
MRAHHICARLQFGDAVTGQVLKIHELMSQWGWESHVYATASDERMADINEGMRAYSGRRVRSRDDVLIYHFSVYDDNYRSYLKSRNRKVLIYHNITPPEFLAPYDPFLAEVCRRGRALLPRLKECDLALGDSEYNRRELVAAGFERSRTGVLPIFVDLEALGGDYNRDLANELVGGTVNILFVGRMVPNKRIEDLIDVFAVYNKKVNADSRLLLVGTTWSVAYNAELARRIRTHSLQGVVSIPGWSWGVSDEDLRAYYRAADVFVTCSRHEGFCVPLLESMFFDLPILARAEAAVPLTLNGAGMTFRELDARLLAEAVGELAENQALREALIARGRERLQDFAPEKTAETLRAYLAHL